MPMKFLDHFDHPERKQDKAHFIHLVQIANADGKIVDSEISMLNRLGSKLGLTQSEIDELMQSNKQLAYIPPYELSKRFEELYDVVKMVFADGEVGEEELKLVGNLAVISGFAEDEIPLLLSVLTDGVKSGEDEEDLFTLYKKRRRG